MPSTKAHHLYRMNIHTNHVRDLFIKVVGQTRRAKQLPGHKKIYLLSKDSKLFLSYFESILAPAQIAKPNAVLFTKSAIL